jgi:RHS repeat-associated protein
VYVGATSLLAEVTTNHLARPVTHDAAGHETGHIVTREYSARNLLRTVWDNAEPGGLDHRVIYGYNGRGVRISRLEVPVSPEFGAERHFVYTRLLAATRDCRANWWDGSADPVAGQVFHYEIIWFGSRPVAQVTPGGATRFTFADHLATPQLQTDSAKNVIWRAEYEPFGSIYEMRVGNRNDQPLRFPGQEAAMTWEGFEENYNIFRWYRAAWGRYTQADPIGFQGGINLYAYVRGNPLRLSDRFGLRAFDIFEVPNIPPMPAGHFPNTECCSKRAIQQSIDSVDGQINRMMNGQTPAGTVVAMTLVAYTCHQGECTPLASDPSLFPWGNYKEDKCANYCINFHEWIHFSDLRSWGEHWSETQKTLFHEFPAYVAEKACLLEMRGRAGKP